MAPQSRIFSDVNFERNGKQVGWLYLPYSVTRSAYGNVAIPVAVVRNGRGPTVLLTAGTHGDEYEGQIALVKLIRSLEPETIHGRIIILPAVNLPAALAGERISPLDGVNLNRAYPGHADGSPTYSIAHYVDSVLFPLANFYHDLHSGGSSLDYIPFASMRQSGVPELDQKALAALKAFGAPIGLVWAHTLDTGFAVSAAVRRGLIVLGGEFGGGGSVSLSALKIVERGLHNLLVHAGCLEPSAHPEPSSVRLMEVRGREYFALAPDQGLFEPFVELGDQVEPGQPCGQVHFVDNPSRQPAPVAFRGGGMVICKRRFGRVERGDCVAHLATDWTGEVCR